MLRGTLAYGLQALDQFGKLDIEMDPQLLVRNEIRGYATLTPGDGFRSQYDRRYKRIFEFLLRT